jgi:hypothetical protein
MSAGIFDILMVVALGSLAGAGTAIITGYVTKNQKNEWCAMSSREQTMHIALVIFFCAIWCGGLGYYFLI